MAIIKCPECGREVSDKAVKCPECGTPLASKQPEEYDYYHVPQHTAKPSKLPIILTAIAGIILAAAVGISVRVIDGKTMMTGETKLAQLRSELASVSSELNASKSQLDSIKAQIESQSKKIEPLKDI